MRALRIPGDIPEKSHPDTRLWRRAFWWMRLLATVGLVAYLVWSVRDELAALRLGLAQPLYLLGAFGVACLGALLSAWVWRGLLPPGERGSYLHVLAHYLWGLFWNNFLPFGIGGDVVRAVSFWNREGRGDLAVSSVMMSRLAGLWSVLLLAGAASLYQLGRLGWVRASHLVSVSLGAGFVGLVGTTFLLSEPAGLILRWLPERWRGWHTSLRGYLKKPRLLFWAFAVSFLIQICAVGVNLLAAAALGMHIPTEALFFTIPLVNLAVLLPVSLGGFGVREGAYMVLLGMVGVAGVDALCLSLAVYVLLVLVSGCGALASRALFNLGD